MIRTLIIFFLSLLTLSGYSQVSQTAIVTTTTQLKAYRGSPSLVFVSDSATRGLFFICSTCTADEVQTYAGAGGKKWRRFPFIPAGLDTTSLSNRINGKAPTVHTHVATSITEDITHRFTTDAEKSTWNGKQDALGFVAVPNGRTINGYPLTANITILNTDIAEDVTHRWTTDAEKTNWNGKQSVSSGTLPDARLTGNVALKDINNFFIARQNINTTGTQFVIKPNATDSFAIAMGQTGTVSFGAYSSTGIANFTFNNNLISNGSTTINGPLSLGATAWSWILDEPGRFTNKNLDGSQIDTVSIPEGKLKNKQVFNPALYALLASPAFNGNPFLPTGTTGVTQPVGDSSSKMATTAYVDQVGTPAYTKLLQLLGSSVKVEPLQTPMKEAISASTMVNGSHKMVICYIPKPMTITGVKTFLTTVGNYTGSGNNKIGLFSLNLGTGVVSLVASTVSDSLMWKTAAISKPFTSTYSASPGFYFITFLWTAATVTTPPAMISGSINTMQNNMDFFNTIGLAYSQTSQTDIVGPITLSSIVKTDNRQYLFLY